jgi:hypothetical protein
VLAFSAALAGLSLGSVATMRFSSEVSDLAPSEVAAGFAQLAERFGIGEELVLFVESDRDGEEDCLVDLARGIARRLEADPLVRAVRHGVAGLEALLARGGLVEVAPLYARGEALVELDALLTPAGIAAAVRKQAIALDLPGAAEEAVRWIESDPVELRRFVLERFAAGASGLRLRRGSRELLSEDGRAILVRIEGNVRSSDPDGVRALLTRVGRAVEDARAELASRCPHAADFAVERAGGYALAFESQRTMRADLERNITLSIALVLAVLYLAWRRIAVVVLGALPVLLGIVLGFGAFSLLSREVVALALVSGALLAGLGVDYVIHFLEPLRGGGAVGEDAVVRAARRVGPGLLFAALTTAAGFLAFAIAGGGFLRDLGLLSACGIGACLLAAISVLPAALRLAGVERRAIGRCPRSSAPSRSALQIALRALSFAELGARLGTLSVTRPRGVLALAAVVSTAAAGYLVWRRPEVEADLRRVHAADSSALRAEERLAERFGAPQDAVLLLVDGASEGEVLEALARLDSELRALEHDGRAGGSSSVLRFLPLPREQSAVLRLLAQKDPRLLAESLRRALADEGFDPGAFDGAVASFSAAIERREALGVADLERLGLGDETSRLIDVGAGGASSALVAVYPVAPLWDPAERDVFLAELRGACERAGVPARASGLHAASAAAAAFVVEEFLRATGAALVLVVVLVAVLLRRSWHVVAALAPVVAGSLWTAAAWSALGFKLHFVNAAILPMLLGIGVDDGIHLVVRWERERAGGVHAVVESTARAVVLTTVTTLAAFGTLAFSSTAGLASIGVLCALGVSLCLLASLTVLPAMLALAERRTARAEG